MLSWRRLWGGLPGGGGGGWGPREPGRLDEGLPASDRPGSFSRQRGVGSVETRGLRPDRQREAGQNGARRGFDRLVIGRPAAARADLRRIAVERASRCPGDDPDVVRRAPGDHPTVVLLEAKRGQRSLEARFLRPGRVDPELAPDEPPRGPRATLKRRPSPEGWSSVTSRPPARRSSRRSGSAGSAARASPWTAGQNGSAAEAGTRSIRTATQRRRPADLQGVDERPDRLDVVADMGDQGDVGPKEDLAVAGSVGGQRAATVCTLRMACSSAISRSDSSIDGDASRATTLPSDGSSARAIGSANRPAPAPTSSHVSPAWTSSSSAARTGSSVRVGSARKSERTGA